MEQDGDPTVGAEAGHARTVRHIDPSAERRRRAEVRDGHAPWHEWGPYLSERQWGTVREDYSAAGSAWEFFPHDHARSRAYRWSEDGLLGISDHHQRLCFALALWNGEDSILKERLFGLTGPEGNHGEDVKEYYFYLDATPTHSYLRAMYRYPQRAFPYAGLVSENARRGRSEPEYELFDTGVLAEQRYFDVTVEYAKAAPDDIVIRITVTNHGPDPAPLHVLPTLWFRNSWSWGRDDRRPVIDAIEARDASTGGPRLLRAVHPELGEYWLACGGAPDFLFTENETNAERLWNVPNACPYTKDGINDAVVHGVGGRVNSAGTGTKAAAQYRLTVGPGETETIWLRLSARRLHDPLEEAGEVLAERHAEADAFFEALAAPDMSEDARCVCSGRRSQVWIWSKQYYAYNVAHWLEGDPTGPPPPAERREGRNAAWRHLNNSEILSIPDKWEYPWFASWDLAFHTIPLALVDPQFAKDQLLLLLREWYMHPNGQLAAYEWAFSDVNPPVHAWAAWRVYKIEKRITGRSDRMFLEAAFHKLLLNFTWWVNRKDVEGHNVFQGGFLGLDNIGVFDRSKPLPAGGHLEQSDGTAWMGMFCLNMLTIALELARENRVYEDVATKFFEHFLYIAGALNNIDGDGIALWDDQDEFFYDVMHLPDGRRERLGVRSLVGLIPLLAVETIEPDLLDALPAFKTRLEWFLEHEPRLAGLVSRWREPGMGERRLLALLRGHRMKRVLRRMLDPHEFLGDHGIRAVSRYHADHPYVLHLEGMDYGVTYEPGESTSGLFGGNSNWRGPVWFPINYLLIEALAEVSPLLRRRVSRRVPHAVRGDDVAVGRESGIIPAPDAHLPARRRRSASGLWRERAVSAGSALAGLRAVLRVLPRRYGCGTGGEPPDRVDGAGGEAAGSDGRAVAPRPWCLCQAVCRRSGVCSCAPAAVIIARRTRCSSGRSGSRSARLASR